MTDRGVQWAVAEQWVAPAIQSVGITSADKYYAWLSQNDLPVTRAVAREVWGEHGRAGGYVDLIERWPKERIMPRTWFTATESSHIHGYGYKFRVDYTDPETGLAASKTFTAQVGIAYTFDQAEALANAMIEDETPAIPTKEYELTLTDVFHRKGDLW